MYVSASETLMIPINYSEQHMHISLDLPIAFVKLLSFLYKFCILYFLLCPVNYLLTLMAIHASRLAPMVIMDDLHSNPVNISSF